MAARTPQPNNRILILGPTGDSADSLTFLLTIAGYEVMAVGEEPTQLQSAVGFEPAVCLLTGAYLGVNPRELAREVRNTFPNRDLLLAHGENSFEVAEMLDQYFHNAALVA